MTLRELGHDLLPLEEVRRVILSHVETLGAEVCPLARARGRVLRQDVVSREPLPHFDNSAMDGFAVRVEDIARASSEHPVSLPLQGEVPAGKSLGGDLAPGHTVRIMTGAPLPRGAEAIVPHELTHFSSTETAFSAPVRPGQNVRRAGGDIAAGVRALAPGCVLRPPQIAMAAALGYPELLVTRTPRIAVLSGGDELVEVNETPGPGKVRNSNASSLAALLEEAGAEPLPLGIIPDTRSALLAAIRRGIERGADGFVSTGGVSAGDYDFVQAIVREEASPGYVFKVAMRPGKPQVFGLFSGRPLFGLPGNPAAAMISFEVFLRPALRKLRGENELLPRLVGVRFAKPYEYKRGRVFLLRARIEPDDPSRGGYFVAGAGAQDSSFLASLLGANAIVVLPADRGTVAAGEVHTAFWLGGEPSWA